MKFHNILKIAAESSSPVLFVSIVLTAVSLLGMFLIFTMPYGLMLIPIAAVIRVVYAFVKGK